MINRAATVALIALLLGVPAYPASYFVLTAEEQGQLGNQRRMFPCKRARDFYYPMLTIEQMVRSDILSHGWYMTGSPLLDGD